MSIEDRMSKLERRNTVLLVTLLAALFVLAVGSLSRLSAAAEIIRCREVAIVGGDGGVVARLGVDDDGAVGLFLNDGDGKVRVSVTHEPEESALFIRDQQGDIRIGVAQFSHGGGGLALHGPESKGAAVLYYKNSGSLSFYNTDGSRELRLPGEKE